MRQNRFAQIASENVHSPYKKSEPLKATAALIRVKTKTKNVYN